jgi:hypothetical protein
MYSGTATLTSTNLSVLSFSYGSGMAHQAIRRQRAGWCPGTIEQLGQVVEISDSGRVSLCELFGVEVANPIKRYLVNSPMLSGMKENPDGSLTLYIQKDSPGTGKESNWLPAVMRLYWPKERVRCDCSKMSYYEQDVMKTKTIFAAALVSLLIAATCRFVV